MQMIKIAIFHQRDTGLLREIRNELKNEALKTNGVYFIYEYFTVKDFREANETSPMDIVFVEDMEDGSGLEVAQYIREKEQRCFLYFFGEETHRIVYGYSYGAVNYLTGKKNIEELDIYERFYYKDYLRENVVLIDQNMDSVRRIYLAEVISIELQTETIYLEGGETVAGFALTEQTIRKILEKPSFQKICDKYIVNKDFITNVFGLKVQFCYGKDILCDENGRKVLKEFLRKMGKPEIYCESK